MKPTGCEIEIRLLEALGQGLSPEEMEEPLRRHLAQCETCREVIALAAMFRQDGTELCAAAPLPSAGRIWWKATMAARQAAAERALRPIRIAEKAALAIGGGVLIALLGFVAPWLAEQIRPASFFSTTVVSTFSLSSVFTASIVVCLLLMAGGLFTLWAEK